MSQVEKDGFLPTLHPTPDQLHAASQLTVLTETGEPVQLGSLMRGDKGGKCIVIFIRHFYCGLCQDFISYLTSKITPAVLQEHNLKLSIIGCGDWELIKPYRENLGTPFEIYSDPTKETYVALGMTLRTLDMGSHQPEYQSSGIIGNIFSSIVKAFKIGSIFTKKAGDQKQLGGEFVFANGQPVYTHRMENTRGHAPLADLFAAAGLPAPTEQ
ncbi:peroxiredoxin-like family protein [Sporobolomyces koalae]|uniref:peroxiredoxin-like family protein n=1 Tax=Sporobolomyces koalae TaxID=500713 RepID=UPI00316DD572